VLCRAAVAPFLRDIPFTDVRVCHAICPWACADSQIRNLGGKLGRAVADDFQAETVGELL
jgi:hypothetical protein